MTTKEPSSSGARRRAQVMMACRSGAPRVSAWGMHSNAPQEGTTCCWTTKGCSASPENAGPWCKRNEVSHTAMTSPQSVQRTCSTSARIGMTREPVVLPADGRDTNVQTNWWNLVLVHTLASGVRGATSAHAQWSRDELSRKQPTYSTCSQHTHQLEASQMPDFGQPRTRQKMTEKSRKHLLRRASNFFLSFLKNLPRANAGKFQPIS